MTSEAKAAGWLLSASAVRQRAHALLSRAENDLSLHFIYRPQQLVATVSLVLDTTRANYPTLAIPFHSRWRHFEAGGTDRWGALTRTTNADHGERARIRFDLAISSVLLDAGAGALWSYRAQDGKRYTRSEGLGLASFEMFRAGLFSADPANPLRCDASALRTLDAGALAHAMQVGHDNPLAGLDGRVALLKRLGQTLAADPVHFGNPGRIGHLFDFLNAQAVDGTLPAGRILETVLRACGPIWPGRHQLGGQPLGDTWRHSAFATNDLGLGWVPLHKLSQWLSYSLIEPLQESGVNVTDLDELTGLAEYRNGGLMLDAGLIEARDPDLARATLEADSEAVVEWRSLTVALLDRLAAGVRTRLHLDAQALPLARVLEGGTWAAGRLLARRLRADGGPPLSIASDGTLF